MLLRGEEVGPPLISRQSTTAGLAGDRTEHLSPRTRREVRNAHCRGRKITAFSQVLELYRWVGGAGGDWTCGVD
jgi:hypothetical protein